VKELDASECRILEADYEQLLETFVECPFELRLAFDGSQMFSDYVGEIDVTSKQLDYGSWQYVYKPVNDDLSFGQVVFDDRHYVTYSEFAGVVDADLIVDISHALLHALI